MKIRFDLWSRCGLAVVIVTALASFPGVRAAPEPQLPSAPPRAAAATFASICKSGTLEDIRPDPAWVLARYDHDNCQAPAMPPPPDGRVATRPQIVAAMARVKAYAAASDRFQKCIGDFLAARRERARQGGRPVTAAFAIIENHRVLVSEKDKKQVARRMNAAIEAFNEYGIDCSG